MSKHSLLCQYSRIMSTFRKSQDHSGSVYINENLSWLVGERTLASIRHWTTHVVETSGMLSWFALFCTSCGQSHSVTRARAPDMFRSSSLTTRVFAPAKVHTLSQNLTNVSWSPHSNIVLSLKNVGLRLLNAGFWNVLFFYK